MRNVATLTVALGLFLCAGCIKRETKSDYKVTGLLNGEPVALTVHGDSKASTGVDVSATIKASVNALKGDFMGALDSLGAQVSAVSEKQDEGGTDWGTIGTLGSMVLGATGYGVQQSRQRKKDNERLVRAAAKLPEGSDV